LNISVGMMRRCNIWCIYVLIIVLVLIPKKNCDYCKGLTDRPCNFETLDFDGNSYVSFEELIQFISQNPDLAKETIVKYVLIFERTFYQNDFNDDGQLSKFEWERGSEVISVLSRIISAIFQFGSSAFDEYVNLYLEMRNCDFHCLGTNCDRRICEQKCTTFEFEYKEVAGVIAMDIMFLKMQEDVKKEFSNGIGRYGILIKGKLIGPEAKHDLEKLQFIDLNNDGRLDDKEILNVLQIVQEKVANAVKEKCDIWIEEGRARL